MHPSKANSLWALLLALLAISNPATVMASSAISTSNLSMAAGTPSNLNVGVVPSRHQKMEKRFVGSLRNDHQSLRRNLGRGDGDTVHVGRGGKFELVKKQQETGVMAADENTFDAVQLAALIESIVAGDSKAVSSSTSTSATSTVTSTSSASTSTFTNTDTATQALQTSTPESTTLTSTSSQADATEVTTSLAKTTPPSSTITSTSTLQTSSSSTRVSSEEVAESSTQALTSTETTEQWIWQLVKPWELQRSRRREDTHAGVLQRRQVDEQGEGQMAKNSSEVAATSAPNTEWIVAKPSLNIFMESVPSATGALLAANPSSMDVTSVPVLGSAVVGPSPTSYVEPLRASTSLPAMNLWSAMAVTSSSDADFPDQTASASGSQLGVQSEAIVASGTTEAPQGIGLGGMDPLVETVVEKDPVSTQTPAPSSHKDVLHQFRSERLASTTRHTWSSGKPGVLRIAQATGASDQPDNTFTASVLSKVVPTPSVHFSEVSFPPAVTPLSQNSSQYPLGTGSAGFSGAAGSTIKFGATGDLTGLPIQSSATFTYTAPTSSFPLASQKSDTIPIFSLPAPFDASASHARDASPSTRPGTMRYSHHHHGIDTASSMTSLVLSSTSTPQVTVVASSKLQFCVYPYPAYNLMPSSRPNPERSELYVVTSLYGRARANCILNDMVLSSDVPEATGPSSSVNSVEGSLSATSPTSSALPEVTTIFSGITSTQSDVPTPSSTSFVPVVESSATGIVPTAERTTSTIGSSSATSTFVETALTSDTSTGVAASATSSSPLVFTTDNIDPSSAIQSTSSTTEFPSGTSALSEQPSSTPSPFEQPSSSFTTAVSSSNPINSDSLLSSTALLSGSSTSTEIPQPTSSQDTLSSSVESSGSSEATPIAGVSSTQTGTEAISSTMIDASSSSPPFPTSTAAASSTDTAETSTNASNSVLSDDFSSTAPSSSFVPTATTSQNVSAEPTSTVGGSSSMEFSQVASTSSGQSTQTKATDTSTESTDLPSSTAAFSDAPTVTGGSNLTTSQTQTEIPLSVTTTSEMAQPTDTISTNQTVSTTGNATFTSTATSSPVITAPASESSSFEWASSSETSSPTASSSSEEPYIPSQTYLIYASPTSSFSSWTPDQASWPTGSATVTTSSAVIMPSTATIPSNVPTIIVPYNSPAATAGTEKAKSSSDSSSVSSLISILLNANNYPWDFVVSNSDATSQLFINFPLMIANALEIDENNVTTYALQAYSPAAVQGESTSVLTRWIGYIPTTKVTDLSSYIKTPSSPLYRQAGIAGQLAAQIDSSYPLTGSSTSGSTSSGAESTDSKSKSKNHRDIIIGVCVGIGGALWVALVFWIYRRVKRNHDASVHKRLSEHGSFIGNGMAGGYLPEGRHSRTSSLAASEIDARPSSFYADPSENEARNRRQSHATTQRTTWNARPSSHEQGRQERLSTTGFSSWFRSSGSHNSHSNRLSHGEGFGSPPQMTQLQNPFADTAHRSYLDQGPNRGGASTWRRSNTPKPISKNQIGQPTLQANSLEFTDHR
ncbi:hypothetical protein QFC21_002117 [Naganishia friedmannii]|uniref:Uncharacterized protein n=1 Tax=Naganishia friedmannii TaxID=89922 RepID=A0ACC2VYR0_9TREE|nr:hypothetical protein QFC21_002117 [Naganishia friedmannii]